MAIERNNKAYRLNPNGGNSKGSFQEHDKQMREFRMSHADIALVNGPRLDKAAFLESLLYLRINYVPETGGSALLNEPTDWSTFTHLPKVAKYKISQN